LFEVSGQAHVIANITNSCGYLQEVLSFQSGLLLDLRRDVTNLQTLRADLQYLRMTITHQTAMQQSLAALRTRVQALRTQLQAVKDVQIAIHLN
jgi:hypothetical protein